MSKIDDGGSCTPDMVSHRPQPDGAVIEDRITMDGGVKLRDYFAAAALTGLLADNTSSGSRADFAKYSYEYADAMLAARKEESK